jgi:hypothetical protein
MKIPLMEINDTELRSAVMVASVFGRPRLPLSGTHKMWCCQTAELMPDQRIELRAYVRSSGYTHFQR